MSEDRCYHDQGSYGFSSNNNAGSGVGYNAGYDYQTGSGFQSRIGNTFDSSYNAGFNIRPLSAPQMMSRGYNANSGYYAGTGGGANSGDKRKEYAVEIGMLIAGGLAMLFCKKWLLNFVRNMAAELLEQ